MLKLLSVLVSGCSAQALQALLVGGEGPGQVLRSHPAKINNPSRNLRQINSPPRNNQKSFLLQNAPGKPGLGGGVLLARVQPSAHDKRVALPHEGHGVAAASVEQWLGLGAQTLSSFAFQK